MRLRLVAFGSKFGLGRGERVRCVNENERGPSAKRATPRGLAIRRVSPAPRAGRGLANIIEGILCRGRPTYSTPAAISPTECLCARLLEA